MDENAQLLCSWSAEWSMQPLQVSGCTYLETCWTKCAEVIAVVGKMDLSLPQWSLGHNLCCHCSLRAVLPARQGWSYSGAEHSRNT